MPTEASLAICCKNSSRVQSASVAPFDHATVSSPVYSLSANRADRMRFRAGGRLDPVAIALTRVTVSILQSPFRKACTFVNAVYGQSNKLLTAGALTFVYGRLRTCTLQGVECRDTPGTQHRTGIRLLHFCCERLNHWRPLPFLQACYDAAVALHHRHPEASGGHEGSVRHGWHLETEGTLGIHDPWRKRRPALCPRPRRRRRGERLRTGRFARW